MMLFCSFLYTVMVIVAQKYTIFFDIAMISCFSLLYIKKKLYFCKGFNEQRYEKDFYGNGYGNGLP